MKRIELNINFNKGVAINGTCKLLEWMESNGHKFDDCIVGEPTNPNKLGEMVNKIEFEVENYGNEPTAGVASFNVSPASFGKYYSKLGCFCFEKQELKAGEKATYVMTFYLDPEMVNDPSVKNLHDVTMSYTFFSTDYYKQS